MHIPISGLKALIRVVLIQISRVLQNPVILQVPSLRTYNYPQGRVTDHRIGVTVYNLDNVLNGDIQEFIDALQFAENAEKLATES